MNRKEHLLIILGEECAEVTHEVTHEVTKALRFGLNDKWKENPSNAEKLTQEMGDLMAVFNMLVTEGHVKPISIDVVEAKYAKVEKFLQYSKGVGTLTD